MFVCYSLEPTVGIIAACVPTLKPLFKRTLRYPWSGKIWVQLLSGGKKPSEDTDRLHDQALNLHNISTPQASRGVYEPAGRNLVEIEGDWRYAGSKGEYMESSNEPLNRGEGTGIRKMTEVTLKVSNK